MISERKIKERLIDICAGAGAEWNDERQCFDYQDDVLSVTVRIILGCELAFNFKRKASQLRNFWCLEKFSDLDSMTKFVSHCLECDVE